MADWQTKIDLKNVWPDGDDDPDIPAIAGEISRQLKALDLSFLDGAKITPGKRSGPRMCDADVLKQMASELAQEFEDLSKEADPDADDFDDLMESLYDWADHGVGGRKKICWVSTVI